MQLLYISPPGTRKQESGSYVKLIRLISLRNTHPHLPSAALASLWMHLTFLRTPAALTGADISWWLHADTALPLLLSSLILLYSCILIFSNSFLSAFFISAARRKRGAQINKKNNETHKKRIQNKKIRQENRGCHKEIIEQWKGEKMDAGREGTRLVSGIP